MESRNGILFVVSAPSGAGKSTLCYNLRHTPEFVFSVSCTTRESRPGEVDGEDYFFISRKEFQRRIEEGKFLEYAKVHGNYYGTLRSEVVQHLKVGHDVMLDVDVVGARTLRGLEDPFIQQALIDVFILPPSLEVLEKRLRKRGTESDEQIQTRLENAAKEMPFWHGYRYTIVSGSVEEDLQKFRAIMRAERCASHRLLSREDGYPQFQ
ncbi:MAG: guanylate kinase [Verrucomicrobiota bacterium]